MNAALAQHVLDELRGAGVKEICVCPGGRNAPWVELLAESGTPFKVTWHFEERAAAFFALGRTRAACRPVAVCTTSGTAAGELLPATMEAFYSGLPLILLTADRPRRFRGSGAPQSAEQWGLFGLYTRSAFDLEFEERLDLSGFEISSPLHINVCFEEPGSPSAGRMDPGETVLAQNPGLAIAEFLQSVHRPLVAAGSLTPTERPAVERFLLNLQAPVYAESLSGLRESACLESVRIGVGDKLLKRAEVEGYSVDGVLRIGGVPTHRLWRDLEEREADVPVLSVSRLPFSGLGRGSMLCFGDISEILGFDALSFAGGASERFLVAEREMGDRLSNILEEEPRSEPGMFRALSKRIESGATVFLGNSLPVREWDLAATAEPSGFEVLASRGLNGIDGQVSTFLGICKPARANWAILGDLTTLYDLASPWVVGQLETEIQATIVVLNNSGGRIFDRMFRAPEFQNAHGMSFKEWAGLWGLGYQLCHSVDEFSGGVGGIRVIELRPDVAATARFWRRYEEALT